MFWKTCLLNPVNILCLPGFKVFGLSPLPMQIAHSKLSFGILFLFVRRFSEFFSAHVTTNLGLDIGKRISCHSINNLYKKKKKKKKSVLKRLNPYLPSGLVHPFHLDESIFNFRGVRCIFLFLSYFCKKFLNANCADPDRRLTWVYAVCLDPKKGTLG